MKKFKILAQFVKDISSETKDIQTYLFVKEYISKYQLTIDITSLPSKNKLVENIYSDHGFIEDKGRWILKNNATVRFPQWIKLFTKS